MAQMTPGNRLYLYQLLSRELGMGHQTLVRRVEEIIGEDGWTASDLGFNTTFELLVAVPEFIRITIFKRGRIFATLLANEDYNKMLDKLEAPAEGERAASPGRQWKRRRSAKDVRPTKPRHVATRTSEPEPAPEPEAEPAGEPEAAPELEPEPELEPALAPETEAEAERAVEPEAAPEPAPAPAPEPAATPAPAPEPAAAPAPEPSINLTITYVPEDPNDYDLDFEPAAPAVEATPLSQGSRQAKPALPQDFRLEVRCPNNQLSLLYQVLPPDENPFDVLEEDFRVAQSLGTITGTRSAATFPLRYLRATGEAVVVTLRREAKSSVGKPWYVASVEADEPESVGLDGLAADKSPVNQAIRTFAHHVTLEGHGEVLDDLAQLAAPENWKGASQVLVGYLALVFLRARKMDALVMSPDADCACFDTGLLTEEAEPIYAHLEVHTGNIRWQLSAVDTTPPPNVAQPGLPATPALALVPTTAIEVAPDLVARSAEIHATLRRATRSPRLATIALEPETLEACLLLPLGELALVLVPTTTGYTATKTLSPSDAYVLARACGGDQPSWLNLSPKACP